MYFCETFYSVPYTCTVHVCIYSVIYERDFPIGVNQ